MILNSLPTPITLVECYAGNLDDQHNGPQISYPAVIDGVTGDVVQAHQVPGVRTYPYPTLHLEKNGSPSLIGGVGLYRFQYSAQAKNNVAARALAFSYNSDAKSGPLIGIAFDHQAGRTPYPLLIGIQADLSALGQATTEDNLKASMSATNTAGGYSVSSVNAVWALHAPGTPAYETSSETIVVWVRNFASTFGY